MRNRAGRAERAQRSHNAGKNAGLSRQPRTARLGWRCRRGPGLGTPSRYAERPLDGWEPDPRGRWHPCLVTDVGAFLTYTPGAWRIRRAPDTAHPYPRHRERGAGSLAHGPGRPPTVGSLSRTSCDGRAGTSGQRVGAWAPVPSFPWLPTISNGRGPPAPAVPCGRSATSTP